MCSRELVKLYRFFSRLVIFMTSVTIGFLETTFISLVKSLSMFLNLVNSLDSIDLMSAEPKKMPSR